MGRARFLWNAHGDPDSIRVLTRDQRRLAQRLIEDLNERHNLIWQAGKTGLSGCGGDLFFDSAQPVGHPLGKTAPAPQVSVTRCEYR